MSSRERIAAVKSSLTLPVVAAPMFLVSGPDLVIAACRSGIVGSFPGPNARTIEILDEWMSRISREVGKAEAGGGTATWALNLVVHQTYERLPEELELVARYKPPIVVTALGSPRGVVDTVHAYGGLVIADVNSVDYARKAAAHGVDGLALVSAGAGGHTGSMAGFAFVPAVREFFDGIIVLAGAICDGRAVRAAEVLGADLVYMGTRFIAAEESQAVPDYKQMVIRAQFSDLLMTNSFTGGNAYYLRPSIEKAGLDPDNLPTKTGMDLTGSQTRIKAWRDVWSAGQGVGTIHAIEPVAKIVARLRKDYDSALQLP
jgi:nitronate monooxygenase